MRIHKKIYLKGLTNDIPLLIGSFYGICSLGIVNEGKGKFDIRQKIRLDREKYDVMSVDDRFEIHKINLKKDFIYIVRMGRIDLSINAYTSNELIKVVLKN
jgi:hypothetical protein